MMDGTLEYVLASPHSQFELSLPATMPVETEASERVKPLGRNLWFVARF